MFLREVAAIIYSSGFLDLIKIKNFSLFSLVDALLGSLFETLQER